MARCTFEKHTFTIEPDGIIEAFINAKYMPISAVMTDDSALRIEYYTSQDYPYDVREKDGIVSLECTKPCGSSMMDGLVNMFVSALNGISWKQMPIRIYVPHAYSGMLNLCTGCANISVHGMELRNRLHAQTTNSQIELRGVIATAFMLSTTNAKIYAENTAATGNEENIAKPSSVSCSISSTNGSIELHGFSVLGSMECHTGNGSIKIYDAAIQGALNCTTSNAAIALQSVSIQECAWISTVNGAIKPERLLAHDISLTTTNVSIKGSIVGRPTDFSIDTKTTNGKCNPSTARFCTGRTLTAKTTNGSIALDFAE